MVGAPDGEFVLYWMDASLRTRYNPALEFAISEANRLAKPLVVAHLLRSGYQGQNWRQIRFAIDALRALATAISDRGARFLTLVGTLEEEIVPLAQRSALVVSDVSYRREHREERQLLASLSARKTVLLESNVVVPAARVTDKREYAARTIRPKILRAKEDWLLLPEPLSAEFSGVNLILPKGASASTLSQVDFPGIDTTVQPVAEVVGGEMIALKLLNSFLREGIHRFDAERNDPLAEATSELSPYLRFGMIHPAEVVIRAREVLPPGDPNLETLEEELIVRRELAVNFLSFEEEYDRYSALPEWSQITLGEHRHDLRPHVYDIEALVEASTHDPYWNASMREMVDTGRMRGYMRMYWGKKILEWSESPKEAFETTLYLNNRFFYDGGDPNSYANVAWIFGLHDRPWKEREIFGKVRYMNANGLRRKFDIERYAEQHGG